MNAAAFFIAGIKKERAEREAPLLIVGLGNPGKKYEESWHNLGFLCVDTLQRRHHFRCDRAQSRGLIAKTRLYGGEQIFLLPMTFMNLSGECVRDIARYYRIPPQNILVISDDFDLPLGRLRLRKSGSGGSHNGLKNIVYHLGTEDFPRLRIGFGPKPQNEAIVDYVLARISDQELPIVEKSLNQAADSIELFIQGDFDAALRCANVARPADDSAERR